MPAGFAEPAAARIMIVPVGGIRWIAETLIARNIAIASVATPGRGFRRSSSTIAFRPKGVAALLSPSVLLARFITIAAIAGWSAGMSGKSRRISGATQRATARS